MTLVPSFTCLLNPKDVDLNAVWLHTLMKKDDIIRANTKSTLSSNTGENQIVKKFIFHDTSNDIPTKVSFFKETLLLLKNYQIVAKKYSSIL